MNKNAHIHAEYRAGSAKCKNWFISRFIGYIINSITVGSAMFNNSRLVA
jgi:hypothetical protein